MRLPHVHVQNLDVARELLGGFFHCGNLPQIGGSGDRAELNHKMLLAQEVGRVDPVAFRGLQPERWSLGTWFDDRFEVFKKAALFSG